MTLLELVKIDTFFLVHLYDFKNLIFFDLTLPLPLLKILVTSD